MSTISSILSLFRENSQPGFRLFNGSEFANLVNLQFSTKLGITASTTSTQAAATPLPSYLNRVDTSTGTNTDAVLLPQAIPGLSVVVDNNTANTITVFGIAANPVTGVGDTIAAHGSTSYAATATGITMATGIMSEFCCTEAGKWKQLNV